MSIEEVVSVLRSSSAPSLKLEVLEDAMQEIFGLTCDVTDMHLFDCQDIWEKAASAGFLPTLISLMAPSGRSSVE